MLKFLCVQAASLSLYCSMNCVQPIQTKVPLRVRRRVRLRLQAAQAVPEEGEEEVLLQGRVLRPRGPPLPTHHRGTPRTAHLLPGAQFNTLKYVTKIFTKFLILK